ncbi:MAG: hypothetical protein NkDv07_0940 [Candidatus Improbicoccus devescovinae]|nr:MAG: hypothetical protein NkDv07_0940 [Candidatus Improbicoccus devescovinae]
MYAYKKNSDYNIANINNKNSQKTRVIDLKNSKAMKRKIKKAKFLNLFIILNIIFGSMILSFLFLLGNIRLAELSAKFSKSYSKLSELNNINSNNSVRKMFKNNKNYDNYSKFNMPTQDKAEINI